MAITHITLDFDKNTDVSATHAYASVLTLVAGDSIAFAVWSDSSGAGGTPATATVTDTFGNSYNQVLQVDDFTTDARAVLLEAHNIIGGANYSPTVVWSAGTPVKKQLLFHVFRGGHISAPGVGSSGSGQDAPGTGANAITSGAFTPSAAGSYIFGVTFAAAFNGAVAAGTGFTAGVTNDWGGSFGGHSEYLIQGGAASVAATFTQSLSNITMTTLAMALQPAGVGTNQPTRSQAHFRRRRG